MAVGSSGKSGEDCHAERPGFLWLQLDATGLVHWAACMTGGVAGQAILWRIENVNRQCASDQALVHCFTQKRNHPRLPAWTRGAEPREDIRIGPHAEHGASDVGARPTDAP